MYSDSLLGVKVTQFMYKHYITLKFQIELRRKECM